MAGTPITAQQADNYLKKYVEISTNMQLELMPLTEVEKIAATAVPEVNTFYQSNVNAFVFSKELVNRFFSGEDELGNLQPKADYLMVILSASYDKKDINGRSVGTPTVVITGVNKDATDTYTSLDIPYSADELPPKVALVKFPQPGGIGPINLEVLI